MKRGTLSHIVLTTLTILVLTAGCSSKTAETAKVSDSAAQTNKEPTVSTEPVQLQFYTNSYAFSDDEFQKFILQPVQKKYPYISIEFVKQGKGSQLADLVTAGNIPDLILSPPTIQANFLDTNIALNLNDLIKKFSLDMARFEPVVMEAVHLFGPNGETYAIPYTRNTYGLWYNTDLFDKFGVAYPKDGMTWDQTIDLAKSLTRNEGGVQYHGLDLLSNGTLINLGAPYALPVVDPKTETAIVSEKWAQIFQTAMNGYKASAYTPTYVLKGQSQQGFVKDQVLAMHPYFTNGMMVVLADADKYGFHWDVAQSPSFADAPNTAYVVDYGNFIISRTSKYKDQAFQVIQWLTNDENQLLATRGGKLTVLANKDIINQFAADIPFAKGKHLTSIFKSQSGKMVPQTKYNNTVNSAINNAFKDVYNGKTDINTALRQAKEIADSKIAAMKAAQ